jgi:hypothetical protein
MAARIRRTDGDFMIRLRRALGIGALLMTAAGAVSAQVPWDTPQLLAPQAPRGIGLLAVSYAVAPGDGWGAVITWRSADAPTGLGYRIAAGRGRDSVDAIGGGIEASAWITRASTAFPLDVIWTSGIGGAYGRSLQIALPVGIAAGRSLGGDVWFNPYAASRVIIEGRVGGGTASDELDLQLANEIGVNMSFDGERRFIVRVAAAIGDRSALAVGAHLGGGRRKELSASADRP